MPSLPPRTTRSSRSAAILVFASRTMNDGFLKSCYRSMSVYRMVLLLCTALSYGVVYWLELAMTWHQNALLAVACPLLGLVLIAAHSRAEARPSRLAPVDQLSIGYGLIILSFFAPSLQFAFSNESLLFAPRGWSNHVPTVLLGCAILTGIVALVAPKRAWLPAMAWLGVIAWTYQLVMSEDMHVVPPGWLCAVGGGVLVALSSRHKRLFRESPEQEF